MKQTNRKGQLQGLPMAVMILIVSIILLVLGLVIVQEIRDSDLVTEANTKTVVNETVATVTNLGDNLASASLCSPVCSVSAAINTSSGTLIPTTNYSVTAIGCRIAFTNGLQGFNNSNWNVTYSVTYGDEACTSGNSSIIGLGDFADFIPIIVIALVAGVVIAIILGSFAFRKGAR